MRWQGFVGCPTMEAGVHGSMVGQTEESDVCCLGGAEKPLRRWISTIKFHSFAGLIAQSVEQRPFKALVLGSSPSQPIFYFSTLTSQGNS